MMMKNLSAAILLLFISIVGAAQSGGNYELRQSVIASGGGSNSTGAQFSVSGTTGQAIAGIVSTDSNYSLRGGFWAFDSLAPTAALVSISGRVLTADGQGIRNISVKLSDANGGIRLTKTGSFGYFRFTEVEVGQIYILEVTGKKFTFSNPTRVLSVFDEITNVDFIAEPNW